jgi:hypothetical protein
VFHVSFGKLNQEQFPKLPGIVSNTTWKYCPDYYFQNVKTFPGTVGYVSCIKNTFGTVCTVCYTADIELQICKCIIDLFLGNSCYIKNLIGHRC